ncbi:hypothetical protein EPK99_09655 [Neorhizobium lilium]|uniref:Uncharacterized protein n=1 Tax=Neorhizobium lilium TaxID=2503024 RepID=A0A444LII6_9HYPH|nr:hypothetical protein [Neorhizobium lilium]RWX78838.1 hypothetical protein EPK99_09655 [Neorhizobium lilium]
MIRLAVTAALLAAAPAAFAQQAEAPETGGSTVSGGTKSMGDLLSQGFEIKSSVANGTKFIVFMQKDKSAYACDFVSLTRSRCGAIN